jgi:septal ring factor EnvC (AmiA/AmiB activator)
VRRASARIVLGAAAIALIAGQAAGGAPAQPDPAIKLDDVQKRLEQERQRQAQAQRDADQIRGDVEKLRSQSIATAHQIQDAEQAVAALEQRQHEIDRQIDQKTVSLGRRRAELAELLAALERLALRPPEALLGDAGTPDDTVRAGILLRAIIPKIDAAAAQLKAEIDGLAALRNEAAQNARQVRDATAALQREQQNLQATLSEKTRLESQRRAAAQANGQEAQKLAAQARDLQDLLDKLEAERKRREAEQKRQSDQAAKPPGTAPAVVPPGPFKPAGFLKIPFSATKGKIPLPVRGAVLRHFGDPDDQGQPGRGIVIQTRAQAQVIAPHDGQIVYAGSFLGYGQLLIIEHGEGYHLLLAGLSHIDCVVGQWVLAGEPVGVMGGTGKQGQQLYLELRQQGVPIDPLSWLVPAKDKVG